MLHTKVTILGRDDPPPRKPESAGNVVMAHLDELYVLQGGMASGRTSVAIVAKLPDGKEAFIETSAAQFETMAAAVRGACQRFGDPLH